MSKRVRIAEDKSTPGFSSIEATTVNGQQQVYTVEDAVNYMGFGPFQILLTLFTGMSWIADSIEVLLLSVLAPVLTCDWDLETYQEALLTSVVFFGFVCGGTIWGPISDIIGRKRVLLVVTIWIIVFGLASAVAPNYSVFLLFRFLTGLGIGGSNQSVTYYVEFLPKKCRGACIMMLEVWWALGSILAALYALVIFPNVPDPIMELPKNYHHLNWRIYLISCCTPSMIVLIFFLFVPESARYYLSHGKYDKAEEIIESIARLNYKSAPPGRLVTQEEKEAAEDSPTNTSSPVEQFEEESTLLEDRSSKTYSSVDEVPSFKKKVHNFANQISLLCTEGMWKTSLLLFCIWVGSGALYYGVILLTTTILGSGYDPHCSNFNYTIVPNCYNLTTTYYLQILWTSAAEFPGIFITMVAIEIVGRKITFSIEFIGTGLFIGLLFVCASKMWITMFLFGGRIFATGIFQIVYVYTPEVYPTKVRGIGTGIMTSAGRLGALVTPLIAQALFPVNSYVALSLYILTSLILAVFSILLPIETKGRSLRDLKG